jgi:4-amino-4-deoxy-L-arabinose transferase-like glycosyltransferase
MGMTDSGEVVPASNKSSQRPSSTARDAWVSPLLVAGLAMVLVFPRLGTFGLWSDEGFSVSTSLRPWGDLLRLSLEKETNGALYAWFLKLWAAGGTSEAWLRIPSAIAFVVTAGLTCVLGRRLHSSTAGAVAGVAVCVHGSLLQYGQNIRFYAPVTAVGVAFALCCHRLLDEKSKGKIIGLMALGLCLPLLHLVAGTLLVGAAVLFLIERKRMSLWVSAVVLLPGLIVLAGVALLVSSRNEGQSINQPLGVAAVVDVLYSLTGSNGILGALSYGMVGLVAFVAIPRTARGRRSIDIYLPWVFVCTSMALIGVGSLFTTLMVGRYVLFLVPLFVLGVAIGLTDLAMDTVSSLVLRGRPIPQRRLGGVVLPAAGPQPWSGTRLLANVGLSLVIVVGAVGAASGGVRWLVRSESEDWRPLAAELLSKSKSDDAVLFANDSIRLFVEYQLRQHPEQLSTAPVPVFPSQPWGQYRTGDQRYVPFQFDDVERALARYGRVWLVVERPLVDAELDGLVHVSRRRTPAVIKTFGRAGTLYRFDVSR